MTSLSTLRSSGLLAVKSAVSVVLSSHPLAIREGWRPKNKPRDPVAVGPVPAAHHGHSSNTANITIDPWHLHSLDLRQYGAVTARDLERLPDRCTSLQELALGPYFAPPLTATAIVEALRPLVHLTHLHLDLSKVGRWRLDGVLLLESERDTMNESFWNQLNQFPLLEHLTLLMPPTATLLSTEEQQQQQQQEQPVNHNCDMPGDGLARIVARQIRSQPSCCGSLRSLNLDGNFIGDAGVRALVQAIMSRSNSSCLQHLSLADNQLSSRACSQLVLLSKARNMPPREVRKTIGLVEWTKMGKPRRGDQELEEKISDWRRRHGSTEVSGETESENEEED